MARTREGGLWAAAEAAFCGAAERSLADRLPPVDRDRLAAFCPWFASERREAPRRGISELLERSVLRSGYDLHVLGLASGRRRLANVHKLMRLADAFEAAHGRDLRGFIDHARAELDAAATEADAPVDLGDQDAVRLMTIHAAKGLEFGVVVVAELGRQGAERAGDLLVRDGRLGLRLVGLDGAKETALSYDELRDELRTAEAEEERRVLHVAMTRASERLILSGATDPAKGWPAERPGGCPLAYVGPRLAAEDSVRVAHHTPPEQDAQAGDAAAPGEQLALALDDAAEPRAAGEPAAAAGPPAPAEPLPAPGPRPVRALSYSSLSQHATCSYRFYLERVLGLPEQDPPPGLVAAAPGLEARVRGTLAHELLEHVDLAPGAALPGRDEVVEVAAGHGVELDDAEVADLVALVEAFAASEVRRRLNRASWVRREHAFAFPLLAGDPAGPLLNGVVDVLAREPSGAMLVVDHKTDRVGDADLEQLVERAYGVQRRIYALAALRAGAPAVEVVHLFLEAGDAGAVSARYVAADAPTLQAELAARAGALLAGEYPVTATPHAALCATCPGRDGLCAWPPEMTDRPAPEAVD
jgi:ATP-dependent helicase/nuclease subunit A